MIRSHLERDADELRREALKHAGQPLTPQHAACEGAMGGGDNPVRERVRSPRTAEDPATEAQEEAGRGPGIREGVAEVPKAFRDAYTPPAEYPRPISVHPEDFRRGPIREGHDTLSPGYEPPLSFPAPPRLRPSLPDLADLGGDCA